MTAVNPSSVKRAQGDGNDGITYKFDEPTRVDELSFESQEPIEVTVSSWSAPRQGNEDPDAEVCYISLHYD
jgi:hypothetical protein